MAVLDVVGDQIDNIDNLIIIVREPTALLVNRVEVGVRGADDVGSRRFN